MDIAELSAGFLRSRRLTRAPICFFRHGLGVFFGGRILLLEHTGRRTGQLRQVCLEAVERPSPDTVIIVSGLGEGAQWYRNLRASPRCQVTMGRRRRPPQARFLSPQEADAVLARYQRRHPRAWEQLRDAIERVTGRPVVSLPMVELTLECSPS